MKTVIFILVMFFLLHCNLEERSSEERSSEEQGSSFQPLPLEDNASIAEEGSCPGENCCNQSQDCRQKCKDIFLEQESEQECFNHFSIDRVQSMFQLMTKVFKKPKEDNLVNVDLGVLHDVLGISEKALLFRINKYHKTHARAVLSWMAGQGGDVFSYRQSEEPARLLLTALFRQNARSSLLDDNALLSGLKEPIVDRRHFFEVANRRDDIQLMTLVHNQVVAGELCDYIINRPKPVGWMVYNSNRNYSACILAVYCDLTGSFSAEGYVAHKGGSALRKDLAWELGELDVYKEIENFIETPYRNGGLGINRRADQWEDLACTRLKSMWNDGNLKFSL